MGRYCSSVDRHCSTVGRHCLSVDRHCSTMGRHCLSVDRHCSTIGTARLWKEVFLGIGVVCLWSVTVGQEINHAVSPGVHGAVCSDADRAACLGLDAVCLGAEDAAVCGSRKRHCLSAGLRSMLRAAGRCL